MKIKAIIFDFGRVISVGPITEGHAPPESFDDLVAVTRPGGMVVVSLRCDAQISEGYAQAHERLERDGAWRTLFRSEPYAVMPYGEPEVMARTHVWEVL